MIFALLLVTLAVSAVALDVRMEPSVNVFSSAKWLKENTLNENDIIKTTFVLRRDKAVLKEFERTLLDRATPKSKNYGKWLKVKIAIAKLICYIGFHLFSSFCFTER
jgi:hypothetical protein